MKKFLLHSAFVALSACPCAAMAQELPAVDLTPSAPSESSPLALPQAAPAPVKQIDPVAVPVTAREVKKESTQSLDEVLRQAYRNNPTLMAARAEMRATDELLPQARAGWLPQAEAEVGATTLDTDNDSGSGDGTTSKELDLTVTQPLYRGGRTQAQTNAAVARIMAQRAILNAAEQGILRDVVAAYMNVVRDRALLDLSEGNKEVIDRQRDATKKRFEVGEVTRTDVSQAEARYARAESERIRSSGNLKSSLASFEQLVGVPAGDLAYPEIRFPLPANLDEAIAIAERNNPSIAAAQFLHHSSEDSIGTVFGELLPQIGLTGNINKTYDPQPGLYDDSSSKSLTLSATIPLYEAGSVRSRVREAKHTANQRFIEIIESKRDVRQQVISAWEALMTAKAEIVTRQAEVEANRLAQEGVRQESELGSRTILDSLDADQEALDAQVALVTAQRNEIVATFDLARALGVLTPAMLGFGNESYIPAKNLEKVRRELFKTDVDIGENP